MHNSFWHLNNVCACVSQTRVCTGTYTTCKCANDWNWLCCLYCFILCLRPIIPNRGRRGGWLGPIPAVSACWRVIYVIHTVEFKFGACMSVQRIWRRELEQSPHWTTNLKQELWRSVATAPATRCAICLAAHRYFLSTVKIYKNRFFFPPLAGLTTIKGTTSPAALLTASAALWYGPNGRLPLAQHTS